MARKKLKTIRIPRLKPRGAPVPGEKIIPNPKKEASRKACREPIEDEGGEDVEEEAVVHDEEP